MTINGVIYHPTFLYESLLNLGGLLILLVVRKNKKLKNGMLVSIYLMWYSLVRFFIESMRTDSLMLNNLKMAQVISIALFITGVILLLAWSLGGVIGDLGTADYLVGILADTIPIFI